MPWFRADLHLHSCLSPCGDLECSPAAIASTARRRGIALAALTDHNSALNCPAFSEACVRSGLNALFGMEVTSREEVHLLCLFETVEQALEMGAVLYAALADIPNKPETFGDQVYVDIDEVILGTVDKHLTAAVSYSADEINDLVLARGGIFVPAHIDRAVTSMQSQLGFLPAGNYHAVEIQRSPCSLATGNYTRICNSDAHFLDDIASRWFEFESDAPDFAGLKQALARGAVRLSIEG